VITKDVPDDAMAVERNAQTHAKAARRATAR
jgi:bifunctional N-acetylglucosamine-1-phosphate-uridyltransferase/glucosamine-1-phosphate-acetyltransferase GlmU-like protein